MSGGGGQERRRRLPTLVRMDLDEGPPRVVVHGHVHEVVTDPSSAAGPVAVDPVPTTRRHPTELLHVQVDELAGAFALVASDRCPRRSIEQVQPVKTPSPQHPVDGRARVAELRAELVGPTLARTLARQIARTCCSDRARGRRCGALERSPSKPLSRCRRSHLCAVARETPDIAAAWATGQPRSSTQWTISHLPNGVSFALRWAMRASFRIGVGQPRTVQGGSPPCKQPRWELHLGRCRSAHDLPHVWGLRVRVRVTVAVFFGERPLQVFVPASLFGVRSKIVAKRDHHSRVLRGFSTTCTWTGTPAGDLEEDVILVAAAECVPERLQRTAVWRFRVIALDEDEHIDHRLRGDSGYRGRSHVVDAQRRLAERTSDVRRRPLVDIPLLGIVRHEFDHHLVPPRVGHYRCPSVHGCS